MCWRRLLRVPWPSRRSNQSVLKEISPEYSLEALMLKLRRQYFGHLMQTDSLEKTDAGKDWRQKEKGTTEDQIVGWHHQLDGHEFEQASGVGDGQGSLACCSPWGRKELDTTEWLNWRTTTIIQNIFSQYVPYASQHSKGFYSILILSVESSQQQINYYSHFKRRKLKLKMKSLAKDRS